MRRSVSRFVASSSGGSQSNRSAIRQSKRLRDVLPASFILALPGPAGAQTTTLSGTVMDNQGGVLPGVTVTETSMGRQHIFGTVGGPIVKVKVHRVSPASSPPT